MVIGKNLENKVIFRLQIYYMHVELERTFCVFSHQIVIDTPQTTCRIDFYCNL